MCIIAIKEKQQRIWNREEIQKMMERNSDGAGFMFPENGKVRIIKGLMTADEVVKSMKSVENIESLPIVFHARIETSGGVKKGLTHPFALNRDNFLNTESLVDYGMAHNGVISNTIKNKNWSDTVTFIDEDILPFLEVGLKIDDVVKYMETADVRRLTNYSRFAFMEGNGKISLIGDFVKDDEGRKYSNYSFRGNYYSYAYSGNYGSSKKPAYSGISSYDSYDDYYDYYFSDKYNDSLKGNDNSSYVNNNYYEKYAKYVDLVGNRYYTVNLTFIKKGKTIETLIIDEKKFPHCFITPSGDVYSAKKMFNIHDDDLEIYDNNRRLTDCDVYADLEDNLY